MTQIRFVMWQTLVMLLAFWLLVIGAHFGLGHFWVFEWLLYVGVYYCIIMTGVALYYCIEEETEGVTWQIISSTAIVIAGYYFFIGIEMVGPSSKAVVAIGALIDLLVLAICLAAWLGRRRNRIRFAVEIVAYIAGVFWLQELIYYLIFRGN